MALVESPKSKVESPGSGLRVRGFRLKVASYGHGVQSWGFTLIELIIVLFVAGLIAAFVVPSFVGGLKGMQLKGEVTHLAATLRFARSQAVCSKGLAVVKLDLDNGTYELSVKKKQMRQGQSGMEDGLGLLGGSRSTGLLGGGLSSASSGSGGSLDGSSSLHGSSMAGSASDQLTDVSVKSTGQESESPLAQAAKKMRKLKEGVSIARFTYQGETYNDGVCNIFFFPRGTSTGGLIEIKSESGRSFVIEIEPVTGSAKIKSPEDYL